MKRNKLSRFFVSAFLAILLPVQNVFALTQLHSFEAPLIRGPGITQETLEAFAEAEGRTTLSDHLDLLRPGENYVNRLRKLLEKAQSSWLSGSLKSAKQAFLEISELALKADWREPQRETIHYAYLRLAQMAQTEKEKDQWITKAVKTFPDLQADPSLFPPPLIEKFREIRANLLASAKAFAPYSQFKNGRYLLINGKRFALTPEIRIRLPDSTYRVTVLSDLHAPVTKILHRNELESFHPSLPDLANGTCQSPEGANLFRGVDQLAVLYSLDCVRIRSGNHWLPIDEVQGDSHLRVKDTQKILVSPIRPQSKNLFQDRKSWMYAGLVALAATAVILATQEVNKRGQKNEPVVVPVEREGYR